MTTHAASRLAVLAFAMMAAPFLAAQNPDSARINDLLQQAKEHAAQANLNAEKLDGYTRSRLSWQSHAAELNRMTENINELGKDVAALAAARDEGSPWQQEAIDDIDPLLRSMADHLGSMITHLADHQNQVHLQPYKDYAKANYELSDKLLRMIRDYVDYSQAKAKSAELEQKLQLAPGSTSGEE